MSAHTTRWALGAYQIGFSNIEGWARMPAEGELSLR